MKKIVIITETKSISIAAKAVAATMGANVEIATPEPS